MIDTIERKTIRGLGVSGLATAYLLNLRGINVTIFEVLDKKRWTEHFRRPTLLRPNHLFLLRQYAYPLCNIMEKYLSPIHSARKLVLNRDLNTVYERVIESRNPLYYLVDVEALMIEMLDMATIEPQWCTNSRNYDIDASGGRIWNNIRWYARETSCDKLSIWYLPEIAPNSYMFEAPVPRRNHCTRALILFNEDTKLETDIIEALLQGKPDREGITGYTEPRIREGHIYTVGERGGWIDPLRGYSFVFALLSAKAVVDIITLGQTPQWIKNIREKLVKAGKAKHLLKRLSINNIIEILEQNVSITGTFKIGY